MELSTFNGRQVLTLNTVENDGEFFDFYVATCGYMVTIFQQKDVADFKEYGIELEAGECIIEFEEAKNIITEEERKVIMFHEEAHCVLDHKNRFETECIEKEIEADNYAIERVPNGKVHLRNALGKLVGAAALAAPFWNTTDYDLLKQVRTAHLE